MMSKLKKFGCLFGILLFALVSCDNDSRPTPIEHNPAFDKYLSAYTNGEVSKKSSVMVRFANDMVSNKNLPIDGNIFKLEPQVNGKLIWQDKRTLEFLPEKDLKSGQIYTASLDMASLKEDIPSDLTNFQFQFKAKDQFVNVSPKAATAYNNGKRKWYKLEGQVRLNDLEDASQVKKVLAAYHGDRELNVKWSPVDGYTHNFTIDSVERLDQDQIVQWSWNANLLGSSSQGTFDFSIPSSEKFVLNNVYPYNNPSQHIILEFSDRLSTQQNLEGLITLGGRDVKYTIENNRIKIYPNRKLLGEVKLNIQAGLQSVDGQTLESPTIETLTFSDAEPAVRIVGKGSIIPKSSKMPIVFQSINLNAVDVRVIKIKESNIQQFFQVNEISESNELKRVGTEVLRKKIVLDKTKGLSLSEWTHHSLDLADLIEPEPGAIYEIAIGYRQAYSLYQCEQLPQRDAEGNLVREEKDMLALPSHWDKPNYKTSYWDYYEEDYNYDDLNNPCNRYYYHSGRVAKRNILASDLGIIAKQGDNGNLFVVNNLQTTEPMKEVTLEFYDYHQDLITTAKTGKEGMVRISPASFNKPAFMLIAKYGKQRGYLRLNDGSALSMSRFDVQGNTYHKGLKGFIYSERGVWRPGNEMFINFILEDKEEILPNNHPVKFVLKSPKGAIVYQKIATSGKDGFYNFTCSTEEDAPTGNYTAIVKVGGASFTKTIKVETIKPNRLKIALDIKNQMPDGERMLISDMAVTWLHGALAKNLKATVEMILTSAKAEFPKYAGYNFHDPVRKFSSESTTIFDGKLDAKGQASFKINPKIEGQSPGFLKAVFKTKVYEPGGDFSIDQYAMPYHDYKTYVGVRLPKGDEERNMLLTDTKHKIEFVTVNQDGKPVSGKELELTLYKLNWRWWFNSNRDEVNSWRGKVEADEIETASLKTVDGKASWEMEVKHPQWGRYLVRACDGDNHCSGKVFYIDWPGWAGRSTDRDPEGATALNFTADKEAYEVGEEITLNIPTGFAGRALVTVENGTKILQADWVQASKGTTPFKLKATKDMTPTAYIHVSLLQPHAQTKNDLPIRMYGVIPVKVEDPNTHIDPVIAMADELKPSQAFTVEVSERKGGPMTYTLAVVDEGLLDLTRFKTPSPWNNFYQREALGVKTWDVYNDVLGAFGGEIKSMLSIGGDGGLVADATKKPDRFKPVVLYLGPFHLEKGQKQIHELEMPNYVGSVRTMVVAGYKGAYGSTEKTTAVRQPLMVLGTLPRVLGTEEKIKVPVTVFAMKEGIKDVRVTLKTDPLIAVEGSKERKVSFSELGDKITYFEVKTTDRIGTASIKIEVSSKSHSAVYETAIQVRNSNPRVSEAWAQAVDAGQTWTQKYHPMGMLGTNNAVLEVSSIPPLNLGKRLKYLIRYPYGCVEQTTSSVFPQVYLTSLMELTKERKDKIDQNIKAGIKRLKRFQTSSGGLVYWLGESKPNDWATNYAGHFLLEADKAGYIVPQDFMKKWINYQRKKAKDWSPKGSVSDDLTQAYRLYLLALAGEPELGAMNRMRLKQRKGSNPTIAWNLAASYYLAGQKEVAKKIATSTQTRVAPYPKGSGAYTFGSSLRDEALILQTLSLMNDRAKASELAKTISERLSSKNWLSTQETAQALVAIVKYVGEAGVSTNLAFEYRLKGGAWQKVTQETPLWQLELDGEQATEIEFKNKAKNIAFARLISDGIPSVGEETEKADGLALGIKYVDMNGNTVNPKRMVQGTDFAIEVKVTNTGVYDYNELALNQIFPSGWEIHNTRVTGGTAGGDIPEYQDFRDDRVYTFFDLPKGKHKVFRILLNSSYLGRYYLPAISVEAMYDKQVSARKKGQWVEVHASNDN